MHNPTPERRERSSGTTKTQSVITHTQESTAENAAKMPPPPQIVRTPHYRLIRAYHDAYRASVLLGKNYQVSNSTIPWKPRWIPHFGNHLPQYKLPANVCLMQHHTPEFSKPHSNQVQVATLALGHKPMQGQSAMNPHHSLSVARRTHAQIAAATSAD